MASPTLTNLDTIPLSGLTVQDIKDYIDELAKTAGIMTKEEIETYVNNIAKQAGVMSESELRDFVRTLAQEAGVLSPDDIKNLIIQEVLKQVNEINDNKDYINQIKLELEQEINALEVKNEALNKDIQLTNGEIQRIKKDTKFQILELNGQIQVLENTLENIQKNTSLLDAIEREREERVQLDKTLNQKIDTEINKVLSKTKTKAEISYVDEQDRRVAANIQTDIDTKYNNVINSINILKLDVDKQRDNLNALLLGTAGIQEKIDLLNSISTNGTLDGLGELQSQLNQFKLDIVNFQKKVENEEVKITQIQNDLLNKINDNKILIQNETKARSDKDAEMDTNLAQLRSYIDGVISILKSDFTKFQNELQTSVIQLEDKITDISSNLINIKNELFLSVERESQARTNNDKALDIKIGQTKQDLLNEITKIDFSDDIVKLKKAINSTQETITLVKEDYQKTYNELKQDIADLKSKDEVNFNNAMSRVLQEENTRIAEDAKILDKLNAEITTRTTIVNNLVTEMQDIQTRITTLETTGVSSGNSNTGTTGASSAEISELKTRLTDLASKLDTNYNEIIQLQDLVNSFPSVIDTNINKVNQDLLTRIQLLQTNLTQEVNDRKAATDSVSVLVNKLQSDLSSVISTADLSTENLKSLSVKIDDVQEGLKDLVNSVNNSLINITDSLSARVFNLENLLKNLDSKIETEIQTRINNDVDLTSKIETVKESINSAKTELLNDINKEATDRAKDINDITLRIDTEKAKFTQLNQDLQTLLNSELQRISGVVDANTAHINDIQDTVNTDIQNIKNDVAQEVQDRVQADAEIAQNLNKEIQDRLQAIQTVQDAIQAQKARIDNILEGTTADLDSFKEIVDFINSIDAEDDANLSNLIDKVNQVKVELNQEIQDEIANRTEADNKIQETLQAEVQVRQSEDSRIEGLVNQEIQDRINSITSLTDQFNSKNKDLLDKITQANSDLSDIRDDLVKVRSEFADADEVLKQDYINRITQLSNKIDGISGSYDSEIATIHNSLNNIEDEILDKYTELGNLIAANKDAFELFLKDTNTNQRSLKAVYDAIENGDDILSQKINTVKSQGETDRKDLRDKLNAEIQTRIDSIQEINSKLAAEIQTRTDNESALGSKLDNEITQRTQDILEVKQELSAETSTRKSQISDLTNSLQEADTRLTTAMENLNQQETRDIQTLQNKDSELENKITALDTRIGTEENTRKTETDALNKALSAESAVREQTDIDLQNQINTIKQDNEDAIRNLDHKHETDFTSLQNKIDTLGSKANDVSSEVENKIASIRDELKNEKITRLENDNRIDDKLNAEINRATKADNDLLNLANQNKTRIDSILADSESNANSFKEINDKIKFNKRDIESKVADLKKDTDAEILFVKNALTAEKDQRQDADSTLNRLLQKEVQDRKDEIDGITARIDKEKAGAERIHDGLDTKISIEIQARREDVSVLTDSLNKESKARSSADASLESKINIEAQQRENEDKALLETIQREDSRISDLENKLTQEETERKTEDTNIKLDINNIKTTLNKILEGTSVDLDQFKEIIDLINSIDVENDNTLGNFAATTNASLDSLTTRLDNEENIREAGDNNLRALIDKEVQDRIAAINDTLAQIQTESSAREDGDISVTNQLNANIKTLRDDLTNLIQTLSDKIDASVSDIQSNNTAIQNEIANRLDSENQIKNDLSSVSTSLNTKTTDLAQQITNSTHDLEVQIQSVKEDIKAEENARRVKDTTLTDDIQNEKTNRINADVALENRIKNEEDARANAIQTLNNLINSIKSNLEATDQQTQEDLIALDSKVRSILDGSEIDLEYFQDIVDTINGIDSNNDIIASVRNELNQKVQDLTDSIEAYKSLNNTKWSQAQQEAQAEVTRLDTKIDNGLNDLKTEIEAEINQKVNLNTIAVSGTQDKLDAEVQARKDGDDANAKLAKDLVYNETEARIAGDTQLSQEILRNRSELEIILNNFNADLSKKVSDETQARVLADQGLESKITQETQDRINAINTVEKEITKTEKELSTAISSVLAQLKKEVQRAQSAEGNLVYSDILAAENGLKPKNNTEAINSIANKINQLELDVVLKVRDDLINGRIPIPGIDTDSLSQDLLSQLDAILNMRIKEEVTRATQQETRLEDLINAETKARKQKEAYLEDNITNKTNLVSQQISTVSSDLKNEIIRAKTKEGTLENVISSMSTDIQSKYEETTQGITENKNDIILINQKIAQELVNRENFKQTILSYVDSSVQTEQNRAQDAETVLTNNLNKEIKDRTDADALLQTQINQLKDENTDQANDLSKINSILDNLLDGATPDLDSIKEFLDYINQHDTDIINEMNTIIKGTGLHETGNYTPELTANYIQDARSIHEATVDLDKALKTEETERITSVENMQNSLDTETNNRIAADNSINTKIDNIYADINTRLDQDETNIDKNTSDISDLVNNLATETQDRKNNDTQLENEIQNHSNILGLDSNNNYTISGTNYIDGSDSVIDSETKLDAQIKLNSDKIGKLEDLKTEDKSNTVAAINEVLGKTGYYGSSDAFDQAFADAAL